jgi:hypothetical protein
MLMNHMDLNSSESLGSVQVFERRGPLDFARVEPVYNSLVAADRRVHWIGGDFFALENYLTIKRDIWLCSVVSLILCGFVFIYFCQSTWLLVVLAIGTWYSLAAGLFVVEIFYDSVYSIVMAFTSTFIGFNNEYLIHLSGFDKHEWRKHITGLGSAIGTTLLGFLALLFSNATIAKQFGLVAIGGMIGFVLVMLLMQKHTCKVRYREVKLPKLIIGRQVLFVLAGIAVMVAVLLGLSTSFKTDVETFRFATPLLSSHAEFFGKRLASSKFERPHGLEISDDNLRTEEIGRMQKSFHPLSKFVHGEEQKRRQATFRALYLSKFHQLESILISEGVALPPPNWLEETKPITLVGYFDIWNRISPLPWGHSVGSRLFTVIYPDSQVEEPFPLSPKSHYDSALSDLGRQMGIVFLVALCVMFFYLLPWQQRLAKVIYIFMPLVLSSIAIFAYLQIIGQSFNMIHMMGMILVIALALDYGSIVVSADHGSQEQSKVLLTGLASAISFGSLLLAHHPVIQSLGAIVFLGTSVSLVFALIVQLKLEEG